MREFLSLVESDLVQAKKMVSGQRILWYKLGWMFVLSSMVRVIVWIRLSQSGCKMLSAIAGWRLRKRFIEVGKVSIGKSFLLPHPRAVIIASGVKIGDHVHVGQNVTIGGSFRKTRERDDGVTQRLPIVGNRVMISPGAVIGGPVVIGNDVVVGANSVVTRDVPSNSIVFGQNQLGKRKIRVPEGGGCFSVEA